MENNIEIDSGRLGRALDLQIGQVLAGGDDRSAGRYREMVRVAKKAMALLKVQFQRGCPESTAAEIHFFKQIKPRFYSRYIYAVSLYNYQVRKPSGGADIQQAYVEQHLAELHAFFERNRAFYSYYRSGMTDLDDRYYTRRGATAIAEMEDFEADWSFSTSHDYKLSKVIAHEQFQDFLELELARIRHRDGPSAGRIFPMDHPAWTANLTDAVELIYALKASGSVNNGNIDISELVSLWEFIFRMDLKEYYHKYTDITRRKKEMPVFLNKLRDGLLRWIDGKLSA
jgi:hypothetical protein